MKVSAFSFIHNAISSGYPLKEAILSVKDFVDSVWVVDMQSTDGTRELLESLDVKIIDGEWGKLAGQTLGTAHALNVHCDGNTIIHFEGDEVFSPELITQVRSLIDRGHNDLAVYRIQVEQNFQRIRWYPELVHRVFPRGTVIKNGHTTNRHQDAIVVGNHYGFLWDCTNCFRENWKNRIKKQSHLWSSNENYLRVPIHFNHPIRIEDSLLNPLEDQLGDFLAEEHWTWKTTLLKIPKILEPLVGQTKYRVDG